MVMTVEEIAGAQRIGCAVLKAIEELGELGAPSGVLYAALMANGCTFNQFESLMAPLMLRGYVELDSDCYTITQQGKVFLARLQTVVGKSRVH